MPNRSLEAMYTHSQVAGSDVERDRQLFESRLSAHYSQLNSEAEQLTSFVFAVSAAIWCEEQTRKATQAGFSFPIFPGESTREEKVILKSVETPLGFVVPAEYFYAVNALLSLQVMREERFKMALQNPEEQTVAIIERTLNQHVITERADVNRYQAARRLRALGTADDSSSPVYVLPQPTPLAESPAQSLLTDWLGFSGANLIPFWTALPKQDQRGHLDLLLTVITKEHAPLVGAIVGSKFGVKDANGLAVKNTADWKGLLNSNPELLPGFTRPGNTEERAQSFIRYLGKFFDVPKVYESSPAPTAVPAPTIDRPAGNPLDALLAKYPQALFKRQLYPVKLKSYT